MALQELLVTTLRRANLLLEAAEACHSMIGAAESKTEACWLYHHLGGVIQEIQPMPGTGLEWEEIDLTASPPTIWLGTGYQL